MNISSYFNDYYSTNRKGKKKEKMDKINTIIIESHIPLEALQEGPNSVRMSDEIIIVYFKRDSFFSAEREGNCLFFIVPSC